MSCAAVFCTSRTTKGGVKDPELSFHTFPKCPEVRNAWIRAIRSENWEPKKYSRLCSKHFDQSCFVSGLKMKKLKTDAVPTIFEGYPKYYQQEESSLSENEIKVFCPKCDSEVSHTAEGIQEDQTKILIAKVYHYFEQEYEELKTIYGDLDLTPLSKFRQRTALATGVSETTILQILKEEQGRNADERQEPPEKQRRSRKRSRQTDSSSVEDSSDDNVDDNDQSSNVHEAQTLVVKIEPPEYYNEEPEIYVPAAVKVEPSDVEVNKEQAQTDPISLDVKREPRSDVVDNANEALALNEPAGTKRRARELLIRSDVTSTRSSLFGDIEMKSEEIDIDEEGVS